MSEVPPQLPPSRFRPPPPPGTAMPASGSLPPLPPIPGAPAPAPSSSSSSPYAVAPAPPPPYVPPHWAPPVPVQSLTYGVPVPSRPGIITTIGVMSIIVGSLAILFNAIAGLQAIGMTIVARSSATMAAATTAANAPPAVVLEDGSDADPDPDGGGSSDPDAMPAGDREVVLAGIDAVRRLTPERRKQLDALLSKGGRRMFLFRGPTLTPQAVANNVTDHGQLPAADGGTGPDFFVIGQGRVELNDGNAVFFPDGGGEAVRADAGDAGLVGWEQGLTNEQVDAAIAEIQRHMSTAGGSPASKLTLTPAQVSTFKQQFQAPGQGFLTTSPTIDGVKGQITGAYAMPDGSVNVITRQGVLDVAANGSVTSSSTWGGGAGFGGGMAGPVFSINATAAVLAVAGTLACGAMGVYLLVIGILVLRQSLRGGRLHLIYALVKIPLAVIAGVGLAWMWSSFFVNTQAPGAAAGATPASGMTPGAVWGAAALVLLGCAYPIALLIALRTRTVREYYATVHR